MLARTIVALCLACLAASCGRPSTSIEVPFIATWQGAPISCGATVAGVSLTDLRFYISNLRVQGADGQAHTIRLNTHINWQNGAVVLIDLENGQGACVNGTTEHYAYLVGSVSARDPDVLQFTLGVPFDLNHANPLTATAPLDDSDMHWHWRSGYKFLRAGVQTADDGFWIHTGSAGCEGTVGNITGCRFPNRVEVQLGDFVAGESVVAIDLAELFAGVDLNDGESGDCSSGPAETSCIAPFAALGIDFATGERIAPQRVFSLQ